MRALLGICERIDGVILRIGNLAGLLFLVLMAVIVFDVITRGQGWTSSTKLQELEWHLHAALCFLVFAGTYLRDRHVRIEIFRERWRPRTRAAVEIIGLLVLFLPMCAVVFYFSYELASAAYRRGDASPSVTGLPHRWIIHSFQPLAFLMLLVAGFSLFVKNLAVLLGVMDERAAVTPESKSAPDEARV